MGLRFEPNLGQYADGTKFVARQPQRQIALSADEAVVSFPSNSKNKGLGVSSIHIQLLDGNKDALVTGDKALTGRTNYYIGNDPRKWRTEAITYGEVRYHDVYPGVDVVYYSNDDRELEHDFVVRPEASPDVIRLRISGTRNLAIDENGNLVLETGTGSLQLKKPTAYQTDKAGRHVVPSHYVMREGGEVSIAVGTYDHRRTLVVDPALQFFNNPVFGGTSVDMGGGMAVDSQGNMYVAGTTFSTDFQFPGSAQNVAAGGTTCGVSGTFTVCSDAFVMKVDPSGTVVYFTYLGGTLNDGAASIAIDSLGNAYFTGSTQSANFPTLNAAQAAWGGGTNCGGTGELKNCTDAFVAKLDANGALIYSTFLGGSSSDAATAIVTTSSGIAWVAGQAQSADLAATSGAFATSCATDQHGLCNDGFIAQFSATGSLNYLSYLRGSPNAVSLDNTGVANLVYATGTASSNFVATQTAYQSAPGGQTDGFLVKVDTSHTGSASLAYASYLGTDGGSGSGVTLDGNGKVYVTASAQQVAQVLKLDLSQSGSSAQVYNTSFPSPLYKTVAAPVLDSAANLYVMGYGTKKILNSDVTFWYIAQLDPTGVLNATDYFESTDAVTFNGLAVDSNTVVYLMGTTYKANPGDIFLDRFALTLPPVLTVYPNPVIFPKQSLTTLSQVNVNLANRALTADTISNIAITPGFTQTNNCGSGLPPGIGCLFLITYAGHSSGVTTGKLTFKSASSPTNHTVLLYIDAGVPSASFSPPTVDFGSVTVGNSVTKTVTLNNTGDGLYPVGTIAAPAITESHDCGNSVAPNNACHFRLTFTPKTNLDVPGNLVVSPYPNGSTFLPAATLNVAGVATSPQGITLTPTALTYQNQPLNTTSAPQTVTFANTTANPISNIQFSATGDFAIQSTTCGSSLLAHSSCTLGVTFTPTVAGLRVGAINEADGSGGLTLGRSVGLIGNGAGTPSISLTPTSLSFGNTVVGVLSSPKTITISNSQAATGYLLISNIVTDGPYAQDNNCANPIPPGGSCTATVTFTPTATGSQSGHLTINSNTTQKVASLSGTGAAPVPLLTAIAPSVGFTGSPDVTVTVTGNNFTQSSTVVWNPGAPVNLTTTFVSANKLTAVAPAALLTVAQDVNVSVTTPSPGGGASGTKKFTINANHSPTGALETALYLPNMTSVVPQGNYITITGWAADPDEGSPIAQVQVHVDPVTGSGSVIQNATLGLTRPDIVLTSGRRDYFSSGWTAAIPTTALGLGTYSVSAVATDSAGATFALPTSQIMTVDVSGSGPAAGIAQSLTFGNMVVGGTLQQVLSLTNVGSGTLTVSNLSSTGPFAVTGNCGTLAAGTGCALLVSFAPQVVGPAAGILSVTTNGTPAVVPVSLSGNGIGLTVTAGRTPRPTRQMNGQLRVGLGAKNYVNISAPGVRAGLMMVRCSTDQPGLACQLSSSTIEVKDESAALDLQLVPKDGAEDDDRTINRKHDRGKKDKRHAKVSVTVETPEGAEETIDLKADF